MGVEGSGGQAVSVGAGLASAPPGANRYGGQAVSVGGNRKGHAPKGLAPRGCPYTPLPWGANGGADRYGGQAVIEGVMMRSTRRVAVAVRNPQGEIVLRTEPLRSAIYRGAVPRIPLVRGLTMLWDALGLGIRALMWSADVALGEEEKTGSFSGAMGWVSGLLGITLGIGLFMVLPSLLVGLLPVPLPPLADSLLEGGVRLLLVVGYIWGVGFLPDIRRVFAYHGAEHKTINAYEAGVPLTVEAVQAHSTAHTRCGTSFLLTVVVISVLVLAPLGQLPLLWRALSRILAIPLIVGLAYEWIQFSARFADRPWMRLLVGPNLALQRFTTRPPDDSMVEVAIRALKAVMEDITTQEAPNGTPGTVL